MTSVEGNITFSPKHYNTCIFVQGQHNTSHITHHTSHITFLDCYTQLQYPSKPSSTDHEGHGKSKSHDDPCLYICLARHFLFRVDCETAIFAYWVVITAPWIQVFIFIIIITIFFIIHQINYHHDVITIHSQLLC